MAEVIRQGNVAVFVLDAHYGANEIEELDQFAAQLAAEIAGPNEPRIVLDFSGTTYLNSQALEVLVRSWKKIQSRAGRLVFCCLQPFCAELLHVTRLDSKWSICATRAEAIAAAGK